MKSPATAFFIPIALFALVCDANDQFYGNGIGNKKFKNLDEAADYVAKNVDDVMSAGNESGALYLNCSDGYVRLAGYVQGDYDHIDFGPAVASVQSKSLFTGKRFTCDIAGTVHTHPWGADLSVDGKTGSLKMSAPAYGASPTDFQNLLKYGRMDIVDQGTKDIVSYRVEDGVVVSYKKRQGESNYTQCDKYCFDESGLRKFEVPTINGSLEINQNLVIDPNEPSRWNDGTPVEGKSQTKENSATVQTDIGGLKKDTLRSLADLLETGEDIVEVRQDMREDRAERKAKERAERERQAAEEAERLRQQQLAEQRKKDSQKKNSDQKPASNTKKELAKKTEPKQTNPSTTKPKKTASATIDTSRLDSAAQRQISYLRSLISAGKPATAAQASTYNSYARATVSEINAITAKINSLSVEYEEKRRIAAQVQSKVDRYSSTISSLKSTARANGILK